MINKQEIGNGIRIIHEKMTHVRSVSIGIWVAAGTMDELENEAGLAHFIEHMLFKGTTKHSAKSIAEQFDRIGGELNAFTTKEATCFHTTVLKMDAELATSLLADMLMNSIFEETEIAKEKQVVLEEIAMYDDTPDDEVHEQLWGIMFPNHPVGKPILGSKQSVLNFTKQAIQDFMNRLYQPHRIVISIAGNYDDQFIYFIEKLFNTWEVSGKIRTESSILTADFCAASITTKKDIEQAHLCIGYPSITIQDERRYDLGIVNHLIGGSMSSRLFQEVRENQGLAYSIYSYYALYDMTGVFVLYGGTARSNLEQLQATISLLLQEIVQNGVRDNEFILAKQSVMSSFLLGNESTESRMARNANQEILFQTHTSVDEVSEKISNVDKKNAEKLIERIFSNDFATSIIQPN